MAGPEFMDLIQASLQRFVVEHYSLFQDLGGRSEFATSGLLQEELLPRFVPVVKLDKDILGGIADLLFVFLVIHKEEIGVGMIEDAFHGSRHGQSGCRQELCHSFQSVVSTTSDFWHVIKDLVGNVCHLFQVLCCWILGCWIRLEEMLHVLRVGNGVLEAGVVLQRQGGDKTGIERRNRRVVSKDLNKETETDV